MRIPLREGRLRAVLSDSVRIPLREGRFVRITPAGLTGSPPRLTVNLVRRRNPNPPGDRGSPWHWFWRCGDGVERELRRLGRFVRVVDARSSRGSRRAGPCIHPLGVAPLAHQQRRIDEDLDEPIAPDHCPHFVARRAVRTDRRAHRGPAVPHDLRGHEADAPDVGVAVLLLKPSPCERCVRTTSPSSNVTWRPAPAAARSTPRRWSTCPTRSDPVNQTHTPCRWRGG